jgi:hypothetical protein
MGLEVIVQYVVIGCPAWYTLVTPQGELKIELCTVVLLDFEEFSVEISYFMHHILRKMA